MLYAENGKRYMAPTKTIIEVLENRTDGVKVRLECGHVKDDMNQTFTYFPGSSRATCFECRVELDD